MQDKSPSELFEEAAAYLRGYIAADAELRNVAKVRDKDLALSLDVRRRYKPDSYYAAMSVSDYNKMRRSIGNASQIWRGSEWLDAETLLWVLKQECFKGGQCVNKRLLRDFVYSVVYWNPDLVESY